MKVLGIDPGTHRIGYALLEKNKNSFVVGCYGCLQPKARLDSSRLKEIFTKVRAIIKKHQPDILAVEKLYFFKNQKTAFAVGEARGVIVLAGAENGCQVLAPTPLEVKQALTGYGRASKQQIQMMIQKVLKLKELPKPDDAADALAVAFWALSRLQKKEGFYAKS